MTEDPTWTAVDAYYTGLFVVPDNGLFRWLAASPAGTARLNRSPCARGGIPSDRMAVAVHAC